MTESTIDVVYNGIKIVYLETENRWRFELNGRERFADSLKNAKTAIDTQPRPKKTFKPISAFFASGWGTQKFEPVMITSFCEGTRGPAWIRREDGRRSKEGLHSLIADTPANHVKMAEYNELKAEIGKMQKRLDVMEASLVRVEAPEEEAKS